MEFSMQEHLNELPFPSPGDLPDPGIEPQVSWIVVRFFTVWTLIQYYVNDITIKLEKTYSLFLLENTCICLQKNVHCCVHTVPEELMEWDNLQNEDNEMGQSQKAVLYDRMKSKLFHFLVIWEYL